MKLISPLLRIVRNKYFIAASFFIVWMLFFDPKDWSVIRSRTEKLKDLKQSERHLTEEIAATRKELDQLQQGAGTIEKYAREKFYMKKDNEDLFIVK